MLFRAWLGCSVWLWALMLQAQGVALQGQEVASDAAADSPLANLEPLPAAARTEAEEDRANATVHFLQGRLRRGREDLTPALRHYQRAWRLDPTQGVILREISSLAFELKRQDEAIRYAVIAAELQPRDPVLLRRLAQLLTHLEQPKRALRLYERAALLDAEQGAAEAKPDLATVTVRLEMGRLSLLADDPRQAAASFAIARDALADPDSSISEEAKKLLLAEAAVTYALWGETFLAAERFYEAAEMFRQANGQRADPPRLAHRLARVAARRGDTAEALARLEEYFSAMSSTAGTEPYELYAELMEKQSPDKAAALRATIEKLEGLAAEDAENRPLRLALADQWLAAGNFDKAESLYDGLRDSESKLEAARGLVEIYRRQNQPQKLLAVAAQVTAETGSVETLGEAGGRGCRRPTARAEVDRTGALPQAQ